MACLPFTILNDQVCEICLGFVAGSWGHPVNFSLPECEHMCDLCTCFLNAFKNEIEGGYLNQRGPSCVVSC